MELRAQFAWTSWERKRELWGVGLVGIQYMKNVYWNGGELGEEGQLVVWYVGQGGGEVIKNSTWTWLLMLARRTTQVIMAAVGIWVLVFVVVKSISSSDLRQEGKCMLGFGFGLFVNLYILHA